MIKRSKLVKQQQEQKQKHSSERKQQVAQQKLQQLHGRQTQAATTLPAADDADSEDLATEVLELQNTDLVEIDETAVKPVASAKPRKA